MQEERWLSRHHQAMILQGITDGIIVQDGTGHLLYVNDAAARLLGYPAAQALAGVLPQPQIDILDEFGKPFPLDRLPKCAACRGPQEPPVLLRFRHRDTGAERWSMVKTQSVLNEQEKSMLVVSILQDITELRRAEQSQHILAEASRLLAVSLYYSSGLANLVNLVVPYLADWCVVDVMAEDGSIQRLAIAHADPAKNEVARQVQLRYPTLSPQTTHTIWKVLRTGQAWIDAEVSESRFVAEARDAEHLRLMRELGFRSEMVVPLLARGRALGTITFVRATSQKYEPADLALAEELAQRVAIAVDNIRLYHQAQRLNAELEQRVVTRTAELQASNARLEQEIAERLHTEQALRRSEEHLRSLIENASDIIAILDTHGTLRYVSPSVERILGYPPKSILGKKVDTVVHAEDVTQVLATFQELLGRPGAMGSATFRLRHRDGSWRIFEAIGKNLLDEPAIVGFVVHTRDITERKHAEEQLQQQQEALAQSEKLAAMGSLLAGVAHELNNPLAVVVMEADLLSEESAGGPLAEHAKKITQAAERCVGLVQNFLALARQHPPERMQVPLNALVAETLELLAYPLQIDNIEIYLHPADDLPPLWADPNQLRQVLINLVSNAHQALRETPPPRQLTLSTHTDAARAHVMFTVDDTGPGIPLDIQTRIFEPFFTTKPLGVGTGLGLSLCRGIIEAHGGIIRVQSRPGHGASFLVALPVEAAPMSVPAPSTPSEIVPRHGKSILVVDDEAGIRSALAHLLRRDGHRVETAANGRLALIQIQEKAFDLILCDLRMPQLDGPGLYRELEARQPHLLRHMIFLTGDTLSAETKKFLDGIDTPRLTKPFTVAEARRVVEQALQAAQGSE